MGVFEILEWIKSQVTRKAMAQIDRFKLYGEDDPEFAHRIQPQIPLRPWSHLSVEEKKIMFQDLWNAGWFHDRERLFLVLKIVNRKFNRLLPAKTVHKSERGTDSEERHDAAAKDWVELFVTEGNEELVYYSISLYANSLINHRYYDDAKSAVDEAEQSELLNSAYVGFDKFANHLNHLYQQFGVNLVISKLGFFPRQDELITKEIYEPTLKVLSDPQWEPVSSILKDMFSDYSNQKYSEVIAKAHNVLHQCLRILLGEQGTGSGKGEFGKLIKKAKSNRAISNNVDIENIVRFIERELSSGRATKSTAKPISTKASDSDALLAMNFSLVMIQHCLQNR